MEQHAIPQDITGFQFKLIGNMTIKQFAYVATGVVLAVILYYLPINSFVGILIKTLLIPLCGAGGFIVAFVPIEGRPIDLMAMYFLRAVVAPNQYVFHKMGRKFSFSAIKPMPVQKPVAAKQQQKGAQVVHNQRAAFSKNQQLQTYLRTSVPHAHSKLDEQEEAMLATVNRLSAIAVVPQPMIINAQDQGMQSVHTALQPIPPVAPQVTPVQQTTPPPAQKEEQPQEQKINEHIAEPVQHHEQVKTLQQQLQEVHGQKAELEDELTKLRTQLSVAQNKRVRPSFGPPKTPQNAISMARAAGNPSGLSYIPDTPNVISGIVKDPRGNVLPGILIEIKDQGGNPVRAFKTNALGQFASATPLSINTYTLELEDPNKKHTFEAARIVADGTILSPIEIISHDGREELRKALFS